MREIRFVDTTLRDGQESLWATAMRTDMFLPIARDMDEAGFEAIEIIATTNFKKQIRELREDPWQRIRRAAEKISRTPLRAVRNRYMAAFQITPAAVSNLWLERMAANGVREIRLSDPSNAPFHWKEISAAASAAGLRTIINLIYSISPRHTTEYYVEKARAAARLRPYRICLKDPGGLLTPERTRELVPPIIQNAGGVPLELHTHCNTGLGPLCCLVAAELGVPSLNAALPPLAHGSSNPSLFQLTANLRALNFLPVIDEQRLTGVTRHFARIARREKLPIGEPLEYDAAHLTHQVPGGMISNFRFQLGKAGMERRLPEVLEEIARVRADFGYPIMVTPYSQFIGVQAATNVILGERYREVSDELIQYALGIWGEEEAAAIEPAVKDRIVERPRAREIRKRLPAELSIADVRRQFGGPGVSDDDLLLRYFSSRQDVESMKATPARGGDAGSGLLRLIEELATRSPSGRIFIRTGDLSLRLEQRGRQAASTPETPLSGSG